MDFLTLVQFETSTDTFIFWSIALAISFFILTIVKVLFNTFPGNQPPVWEGIPYIGGIKKFLNGPLKIFENGHKLYGEVFTVPILHKKITFLIGPTVSKHFFSASDDEMSLDEVYGYCVPTFGKGVVYDVNKKIRSEQFKLLVNGLKTESLIKYLPLFQYETQDFFKRWKDTGIVDFTEQMGLLITYTASRTLLGREIRENLFDEASELLHDLDDGMVPLSVIMPYLPIPCHLKRDRSRKKLGELFQKVIDSRRESGIKEDDLLQRYIDAKYQKVYGGRSLNAQEITGLIIATLFAGQHTSSITSSWTGLFLAKHKDWWKKCEDEQREIMAKYGDKITIEILNEMKILHSCIQEALRLHPPLILVLRYAKKSFSVTTSEGRAYTIPKGHIVAASPAYAGRLEYIFKDNAKYDPSRFLEPREEDKKINMGYLPFGAGRHACIGYNFAFVQIKNIFSTLIRNFDIDMASEFPEPDYTAMVIGPLPSKIKYKRRILT